MPRGGLEGQITDLHVAKYHCRNYCRKTPDRNDGFIQFFSTDSTVLL